MEEKMRVYYELVLWEDIKLEDFEELKTKAVKFASILQGLGIMKFNIITDENYNREPVEEDQQVEQPNS